MMGMLKQGLSAAGSAANTVANVGKAVAQGVVGSVVSAAEAGRVTVRLNQTDYGQKTTTQTDQHKRTDKRSMHMD